MAQSDGEARPATRQTPHFLINNALYDAFHRVYGGQVRREPDNYSGYSDHRPDLAVLLDSELTVSCSPHMHMYMYMHMTCEVLMRHLKNHA